jgi:hypothetical protein
VQLLPEMRLSILVAVGAAGLFRLSANSSAFPTPSCTCACCVAQCMSVTSEVASTMASRAIKCAPPSYGECNPTCKSRDSILKNARKNADGSRLVDYSRFCFYECKPPANAETGVDRCGAMDGDMAAAAATLDGNGKEVDSGSTCQ